MKLIQYPSRETWASILQRPTKTAAQLDEVIATVFEEVQTNGDTALKAFTAKFDGVDLDDLKVSTTEIEEAKSLVSEDLKHAIQIAKQNIEKFHEAQKETSVKIETMPGVTCWRKSVAIEKVGLYIPGGTAPLFSTVLMLAIPAKIAGCQEIVLCSPPNKAGKIHPAILYAADLVGIKGMYKLGGSQAIAALALGTESIPKVHKIFGPGNQYVTAAKQYAQKVGVAMDLPAGPSEVLVLADESADAGFIAADLLSQAEHGIDSQVVFVTYEASIIDKVTAAVEEQLAQLPRKDIAKIALEYSSYILVKDKQEASDLINEYAPEHFIIAVRDEDFFIEKIINAGSVFLGNYTPESAGDYASGTNHTLPTNGYAKAYSGVSLDSFIKKITFQKITAQGLKVLGPHIEKMAEAEELIAHKNAVSIRLASLDK